MAKALSGKVYVAGGFHTTYFGSGRKEFHPKKPMRGYEEYIKEAAEGTCSALGSMDFDEGVISNFMAPRYLKQANLPGLLPYAVPSLAGKPCIGVEGACGSGGLGIATGVRSILSGMADSVFLLGFEVQNTMKAVYGADVLAGAGYYRGERKKGYAHFFPGIFAERAGAYFEAFGETQAREGMAKWYELSIVNARKNPKAQEYHNSSENLFRLGMTQPDPDRFVPNLNLFDCSKVSDGASSLALLSEEGLERFGIPLDKVVQVAGIGGAQADLTAPPDDLTSLSTTAIAVKKALDQAGITIDDLAFLELHDCFSISGLMALEAIGFAPPGGAPSFVLEGNTAPGGKIPTNLSGGLGGFGHPVGASGVRQLADLQLHLTGQAPNTPDFKKVHGLMVSMGGNDKTVTAVVVKPALV